jgi:mannitol/fructose-specific phosphotransferase system IIA component (Ntr-type)
LLVPELVVLDVVETRRCQAIREVAGLLKGHERMKDFEKFYQEVLKREREETTCLGCDTAIPHARTDHVSGMVLAVGRSREGVLFENSNQRVHFLFVVGTPKQMAMEYLRVVGTLARLMKREDIREQLSAAATPMAFIEVLSRAETAL